MGIQMVDRPAVWWMLIGFISSSSSSCFGVVPYHPLLV
jgi:hypothetical protein